MQTLDDQHRVLLELYEMPDHLTRSRLEIEVRNLHAFAGQKRFEVDVELIDVDHVDMLVVDLAVFVGLDILAVDVVIVERQL